MALKPYLALDYNSSNKKKIIFRVLADSLIKKSDRWPETTVFLGWPKG